MEKGACLQKGRVLMRAGLWEAWLREGRGYRKGVGLDGAGLCEGRGYRKGVAM